MLKQTQANDSPAVELRQSLLLNGGALPPRPAAELLPPLVEILLEECAQQRNARLRTLQGTVGVLGLVLCGVTLFALSDQPALAAIVCTVLAVITAIMAVGVGEGTTEPLSNTPGGRTQRERALRTVSPPSALQQQATAALAALLKERWQEVATRETLPALVRLASTLEFSPFRVERHLARSAGLAVREILPRLVGTAVVDPAVLRFLRNRVIAGVTVERGVEGAFDLALHRAPEAGPIYNWDFAIAALLVLGEAGDDGIVPTAEALSRRHPLERVRAAADECLRAHRESGR